MGDKTHVSQTSQADLGEASVQTLEVATAFVQLWQDHGERVPLAPALRAYLYREHVLPREPSQRHRIAEVKLGELTLQQVRRIEEFLKEVQAVSMEDAFLEKSMVQLMQENDIPVPNNFKKLPADLHVKHNQFADIIVIEDFLGSNRE